MLTCTVDSVGTNLTWDASSNLVATSGQGGDLVYLYDAGGQRVAHISVGSLTTPKPVKVTAYFGATQVTDPDTANTGEVEATRYFTFGGSTVATATSTAGAAPVWSLLFGDIQGSAQVMMELVVDTGETTGFEAASTTHTVTRDAYMPYGAERGGSDLDIDRGWLGQLEDQGTGLTYLNARYYDPAIGRFLSPDPLMNPGDPRTLDPYRYADNNPIVYTDATGLAPSCAGLAPGTTAYNNCNNYSNDTYNYLTGKTVAENNIENNLDKAKSGNTSGGKKSGGSSVVSEPVVVAEPEPYMPTLGSRAGLPPGVGYNDYRDAMNSRTGQTYSEWWQKYGDETLLVVGLVGIAACIVFTAGVCAVATVAITTAVIIDGVNYRGMTTGEAVGLGVITLATLGTASVATSTMRYVGMSATSARAAETAAARYGTSSLLVPRTAYIGTQVTTNLPSVLMEGSYVEPAYESEPTG